MLLKGFEKHLKECRGAIHVGGNDGAERCWYDDMWFKKVIWFEPDSVLFHQLAKNLTFYPDQRAVPFGIHDTLKEATLNIASNNGQSSSILELGTHAESYPRIKYIGKKTIKLVRLDEIIPKIDSFDSFNFINVDVQGVELNVLKSLGENIIKFDYIYTEVNEEAVYKNCSLISEIDKYLQSYNFIRVETIMKAAHWGDALYIKKELV
jgi:FkbM family methyltransferase